jgi:hypothetical protein
MFLGQISELLHDPKDEVEKNLQDPQRNEEAFIPMHRQLVFNHRRE